LRAACCYSSTLASDKEPPCEFWLVTSTSVAYPVSQLSSMLVIPCTLHPNTLVCFASSNWDYPEYIPEDFSIDQNNHPLFGALEGGGGCDGAGIWPLLQHAHLLPPWGVSHFLDSAFGARSNWAILRGADVALDDCCRPRRRRLPPVRGRYRFPPSPFGITVSTSSSRKETQ